MSLVPLYHAALAEVRSSRSAKVRIGPFRNGEPSRTHSVSYSPIIFSHNALSRASPAMPTEGVRSAGISVSAKIYCGVHDPASEW